MFLITCLLLGLAVFGESRRPQYARNADSILGEIAFIEQTQSSAFGYWAQLADEKLIPLLSKASMDAITILLPYNVAFEEWIVSQGGNSSDPESLTTTEWKQKWNDAFEFFFFKGTLNVSAVEQGQTVILDSFKNSPIGHWPLQIAFRRDESVEAGGKDYNGSLHVLPSTSVDVAIPDYTFKNTISHVVSGWIQQPQNLSQTVKALNISAWDNVRIRLPSISLLDSQRSTWVLQASEVPALKAVYIVLDFTLLLPPQDSLATALTGSNECLLRFVNGHLIMNERVFLTTQAQTFTTLGGLQVEITDTHVSQGTMTTEISTGDVISNGGVIQKISGFLWDPNC